MSRRNASLRSIFSNHKGNVSDKWEIYLDEYARLFEPYRDLPIQLLEIGIQNGGSLEVWAEYFRDAKKIVGCDIDPLCAQIQFSAPNIEVVVGDASAPETVSRIRSISSEFHLVIDDGSHKSDDIVKSFSHYFGMVQEGGMYVAEDLHCSYWAEYGGGIYYPFSSIMFFKALADTINQEHWGIEHPRTSVLERFHSRYGAHFDETALSQVHSVEFVNSMCIVRKAPADQNTVGRRCISGSTASVFPAVLGFGAGRYNMDQTGNPWTNRTLSSEEEIEATSLELSRLRSAEAALSAEVERLRQVEHELAVAAAGFAEREKAYAEDLLGTREQINGQSAAIEAMQQQHALELGQTAAQLRLVDEELKSRAAEVERLLGVEAGLSERIVRTGAEFADREKGYVDELLGTREQVKDKLAALETMQHQHALELAQAGVQRERREAELQEAYVERERTLFAQLEQLRARNEALLLEGREAEQAHACQLNELHETSRRLTDEAVLRHRDEVTSLQDELSVRQSQLDAHMQARVAREEEFAAQLQHLQQAMMEREAALAQAHAHREQGLLTTISESSARCDMYVLQMAEIQKAFVARLEKVDEDHRSEAQARLQERSELVRQFEARVAAKDRELAERDELVVSYRSMTNDLQGELQRVHDSLSWRLGQPWRKVRAAIRGTT